MYAFKVLVLFFILFFLLSSGFYVDNVQRQELVNLYGVERYIRVIIIIM